MQCNAEVRFPIRGPIGGVIFQDIGTLIGCSYKELDRFNLLAATGFGFRLYTPFGPLRFDIGWKWRRQRKFESSYAWFLSLGNAF